MSESGMPGERSPGTGPYVGPRPFRRADAARFFGRTLEARDVRSLWLGGRITVLHGPAAAGKTSLLHAGVLPLLGRQNDIDLLLVGSLDHQAARRPAAPSPHNSYVFSLLDNWAQTGHPAAPGISIADYLSSRLAGLEERDEPGDVLAAIDHCEALFTAFPARQAEREGFISQLAAALRELPTLKLLLVIADDNLATLGSYQRRFLPDRFSYVELEALRPDAALEAASRTLAGTGRSFADGVAEELVERLRTVVYTDLAGESATVTDDLVEPLLLQIVGGGLWSSLPPDAQVIGLDDLRAFGDVDQALIHFYDLAVRAVQLETRLPEKALRAWIESAFITEHGTRGAACRGSLMTAGMPNEVAEAFEQQRLISLDYRARSAWYQLGQDRMILPIQESNNTWRRTHEEPDEPSLIPATPAALRVAAEAALAEGNYPVAWRLARSAAASYREAGDTRRLAYTLVLQGDIARAEGDLAAAQQNLQEALSTFTVLGDRNSTVRTLCALADVHFADGDYQQAAALQREAIERLPADVQAQLGLAYAQWYGGSAADAEATFTQALGSSADSAVAFGGRGQVRAEMREYGAALADLDRALSLGLPPTEEIDVRSARALVLAGLERDAEADAELALARALDTERGRTLRRAARIAAMRHEYSLAVSEAERALRADPPLPAWDKTDARNLIASMRLEMA